MNYYLVGVNKIVSRTHEKLSYHSALQLTAGQLIEVPIGTKKAIAVVLEQINPPEFETKEIIRLIEKQPLPSALLQTLLWMKDFYLAPLASVLQTALPAGITKKRRPSDNVLLKNPKQSSNLQATIAQQKIIDTITQAKPQTHLLRGVTGSGKTTVYIELARQALNNHKSVLIIIPEIALTTQLTQQFMAHFESIVLFHSGLTESTRHQVWQACLQTNQPLVVIGTRSSLFLPLANLGLIVIDEMHEVSSLKQDKNPKYSSLQVASILAHHHQAKLVLGSATPLVSDYWFFEQKNCSILELSSTALEVTPPKISLIDMRQKSNFTRNFILSNQLLSSIQDTLKNRQQVLIFHNRRGSASATFCKNCGWVAECPDCHIPLSLHHDQFILKCHNCNHKQTIPTHCPACHSAEIEYRGIGTKLIESELTRLFPDARIRRFDADTPTDESVANSYHQLENGDIDILIGTQVIAKGLNLPNLTTVGVIQADTGLALPDFIAAERTFQLLTQVIGRVGRNQKTTEVIVQTYQPDSPSIQFALKQDYPGFYQHEIAQRKKYNYPPFCFLLKLTISYKTEAVAIKHARNLATKLRSKFQGIEIIGPAPSFYEKRGNKFYWQLTIKAKKRPILQQIVRELPPNWHFDLDSSSLL